MHVEKPTLRHALTLRRLAAALLLASPLLALHAGAAEAAPPVDPLDDCEQYSMAGKHDCLAKLAGDSALALKQAQAEAAAAIARWDEIDRYIKVAGTKLKASNAAFAAHRDAQCALAMAVVGGGAGNARDSKRLGCVVRMNLQRAGDLASETGNLARK